MDLYDREYAAEVINFFWPQLNAKPNSINEEMVRVAFTALSKSKECSKSMDLVPRPTLKRPDIGWVIKQLKKIGKRIRNGQTGIYIVCREAVSYGYIRQMQMAAQGL